jgi:hypothetical protein
LQALLEKQQQENARLQKTILESVQTILTNHFVAQQQQMKEYVTVLHQSFDTSIQGLFSIIYSFFD